ncbi:MAG: DUF2865 domain-containing protein, partial [Phyllobacterium sp.]
IEAALDANNCPVRNYQYRELPRLGESEPDSYEVLGDQPDPSEPPMSTAPAYGGPYQTVCVRACDGYYFPLSYETSAENFPRDQAQCQSQCPGADLFYKETGDDDPQSMVSLSGKAYKDTPNAFKFRNVGANATPQCSCQTTAGNYTTMGNPRDLAKQPQNPAELAPPGEPAPVETEPLPPATAPAATLEKPDQPAKAPPATEKPSSIQQMGQSAPSGTEAPLPKPLSGDRPIDPNRKVRVVGPTFLPDQAGAINLRAPDPKSNP